MFEFGAINPIDISQLQENTVRPEFRHVIPALRGLLQQHSFFCHYQFILKLMISFMISPLKCHCAGK